MNVRRIQLFISATTYDLASARELVKEALYDYGCMPVMRPEFPPDQGEARRFLTQRIANSEGFVHIVGQAYGGEPTAPGVDLAEEYRRSYTQIEYDIACELEKPIFVLLCQPGFDYDPSHPEDPERQDLQQAHRQAIVASGLTVVEVASCADLASQVGALHAFVDGLHREIARAKKRALWSVAVAALVFGVLAPASCYLQGRHGPGPWSRPAAPRSPVSDSLAAGVLAELSRQGLALRARAEAASALDYPNAFRVAAQRAHLTSADAEKIVGDWVAGQRASADPSACGRAEFLARNYPAAAGLFARAATEELRWADHAFNKKFKLRDKAVADWQRAGEALRADGQLSEALARFDQALTCASRVASPQTWAGLQNLRGLCHTELGLRAVGASVPRHLDSAAAAYRAALEVWTRPQFPQDWARLQEDLGVTLGARAERSAGPEAVRLFTEAAQAYRAALEVVTAESSLPDHTRIAQDLRQVEAKLPALPPRSN
jgi:tetratricopeptide (TPR) repeat protein